MKPPRKPPRSAAPTSGDKKTKPTSQIDPGSVLDDSHKFSGRSISAGSGLIEQNTLLQGELKKQQSDHDETKSLLDNANAALKRLEEEKEKQQREFDARFGKLDREAYDRAHKDVEQALASSKAETRRSLEAAQQSENESKKKAKSLEDSQAELDKLIQSQRYGNAEYLANEKERLVEELNKELQKTRNQLEEVNAAKFSDEVRQLKRAGEQRRHERANYQEYRSVWRKLDADFGALDKHLLSLFEIAEQKALLWKETKRRFNPEKIEAWFPLRYPKITAALREMLANKQQGAEQSAKALKGMILQMAEIGSQVRSSGHYSRVLTLHHRFDEDHTGVRSVALAHEMLNERPLVEVRTAIDAELRHIDSEMQAAEFGSTMERLRQRRKDIAGEREAILNLLAFQVHLRDAMELDAISQASFHAQEVFQRPAELRELLRQGDRAWAAGSREASDGREDDKDSVGKRKTFTDTRHALKVELRDYERAIRKRQLLQDSLGVPLSDEEKKRFTQGLAAKKASAQGAARSRLRQVANFKSVSRSVATTTVGSETTRAMSSKETTSPKDLISLRRDLERKISSSASSKEKRRLRKKLEDNERRLSPRTQRQRKAAKEDKPSNPETRQASEAPAGKQSDVSAAEVASNNKEGGAPAPRPRSTISSAAQRRRRRQEARERFQRRVSPRSEEDQSASESSTEAADGGRGLNFKPTAARQAAHSLRPSHFPSMFARCFSTSSAKAADTCDLRANLHDLNDSGLRQCQPFFRKRGSTATSALESDSGASWRVRSLQATMQSASEDSAAPSQVSTYAPPNSSQETTSSSSDPLLDQLPDDADISLSASESDWDSHHGGMADAEALLPQLNYHMSTTDHRNAVMASANMSAAYWSYKLYKNTEGKSPPVYYCTTMEQAETRAKEFLSEPVIGFDIEWEMYSTPSKSGIKKNVSLIQIAADDKIALFHLAVFKGETIEELMPATLRQILESRDVIKTGVNIQGDASRLDECLNVKMTGIFELSHLYRVVMFSDTPNQINRKPFKLADQVQNVLMLPLKKDAVRTSAWSKRLDMQQTEYAASDAYAGFRLFHALEARRQVMDPMPPRPAFWEEHKPIQLGDGTLIQARSRKKVVAAGDKKAAATEDDDEDEEFFDALETLDAYDLAAESTKSAGVPLAGLSISYPSLPSLEDQLDAPMDELKISNSGDTDATAEKVTKRPGPPESEAITQAEQWVAQWREARPVEYAVKASHYQLRAYALWHQQRLDCKDVASLLRDPPLSLQTVATYVLEALRHEKLDCNGERVQEVLGILPSSVRGRYSKVVNELAKGQ